MKNWSLTARLIAVVVISQLLLTAGLTFAAVMYARSDLNASFNAGLQGRAASILALVRYTETDPPDLLFDRTLLPPPSSSNAQDFYEILGPGGRVIARSADILLQARSDSAPLSDFQFNGSPYRALVLRDVAVLDNEESLQVPTRVTVTYASPMVEMNERLKRLAFYVAGTSLLLLLAATAVAAWGVRRGLQPLRELAARAGAVSPRNWSFRAPEESAMVAELVPLANAISTVLDRLKEAFRQQRDFTSDAAHELKTSVAIFKSTLQSLLQRPRAEQEYRAGLEGSLEDCQRLEDLLERMLRLARIEEKSENGAVLPLAATDLASTCEAAIERLARMAGARDIRLELVESSPIFLRADPKDLELVWINLLENAVQYSPAGSSVVLRIAAANGHGNGHGNGGNGHGSGGPKAQVTVEDSGPGVPPAELPYIFERFRRADPSRARTTGGFGLGLAICKALVEAYGGRIEASNRPGQGTEVRVELPVEPDV